MRTLADPQELLIALHYETTLQREHFQVDRAVVIQELQKALDNKRIQIQLV